MTSDPTPASAANEPTASAEHTLVVDFVGEMTELVPGDTLTFGRDADLSIDENQFLHRQLGRFEYRGGSWWVSNVGRSIGIDVLDKASHSQSRVAPGRGAPIAFENMVVRFTAGPTTYEIDVTAAGLDPDAEVPPPTDTVTLADLPMTHDQKVLIVALAESRLREPQAPHDLPTNRQVAQRLDWKITKFNRKLDNVCEKLAKAGVGGLRKGDGAMASDRRQHLVEHALMSGLVTADDLDMLPD